MSNEVETVWQQMTAPIESAWTLDICFSDHLHGWAVNASGQILTTIDGGASWSDQALLATSYASCVGFAGTTSGWVGTLSPERRLFRTLDGGATWREVTNLPSLPRRITSLSVVDEATIFVAGGAYAEDGAAVAWTHDGGASWLSVDMERHASVLSDIHFFDARRGWIIGGQTSSAGNCGAFEPVLLETTDACASFRDAAKPALLGPGTARKLSIAQDGHMAVSLAGAKQGKIALSDDGGQTWCRIPVEQQTNLDGIYFADRQSGWVGGWGNCTFVGGHTLWTRDGGRSWMKDDQAGLRISRFGQRSDATIFAAGDTIYRLADSASRSTSRLATRRSARAFRDTETPGPFIIPLHLPPDASRVTALIWERQGRLVRTLLDATAPFRHPLRLSWDMRDKDSRPLPPGLYLLRIIIDGRAQSRMIFKSS